MSDHLLVATRKGLFALECKRSDWTSTVIGFPGVAVTNVLRTDGVTYAALKHGHFGAIASSHLGGVGLDLMPASFAPDDQPHAGRGGNAERHRRAAIGFHDGG